VKTALAIGWLVVALAATLVFAGAGSSQPASVADGAPVYAAIPTIPSYYRGPRIIHVPQPDDARASRTSNVPDEDDEAVAPPPRRRVAAPVRTTPRWPPRREAMPLPKPPRQIANTKSRIVDAPVRPAPQPPGPRRAVLSAPPPPAEGPTPIRPTPKFETKLGARAEAGEKFAAPRQPAVTEDTPPPGYTPPAGLPDADDDTAK
jgi:hypothetical protein